MKLMLVDDHTLVRRGLAALLGTDSRYSIVAEASNGEEALGLLSSCTPDAIVLDLSMPRLNGLETLRRLRKVAPACRVIILSMYDDEQFVTEALRLGANAYVLKQAVEDALFSALEAVQRGEVYLCQGVRKTKLQPRDTTLGVDLTDREREVLQLIVEGKTTYQVSRVLHISQHTATRHRANMMQKLRVHSQVELVRKAVELGLVLLMPRIDGGILERAGTEAN